VLFEIDLRRAPDIHAELASGLFDLSVAIAVLQVHKSDAGRGQDGLPFLKAREETVTSAILDHAFPEQADLLAGWRGLERLAPVDDTSRVRSEESRARWEGLGAATELAQQASDWGPAIDPALVFDEGRQAGGAARGLV